MPLAASKALGRIAGPNRTSSTGTYRTATTTMPSTDMESLASKAERITIASASESVATRGAGLYRAVRGVFDCTGPGECGFGPTSPTRRSSGSGSDDGSSSDEGPPVMEILADRGQVLHESRSRQKMRARQHRRNERGGRSTSKGAHHNVGVAVSLVSDMESLVRVKLTKPLGIMFDPIEEEEEDQEGNEENSNNYYSEDHLPSKRVYRGLRISQLPPEGAAYRSSKLEVGDELLSIDGIDVSRRSFEYVSACIRRSEPGSELDIIFRRPSGVRHHIML